MSPPPNHAKGSSTDAPIIPRVASTIPSFQHSIVPGPQTERRHPSNHFFSVWNVAVRPARAMAVVSGISLGQTFTQF